MARTIIIAAAVVIFVIVLAVVLKSRSNKKKESEYEKAKRRREEELRMSLVNPDGDNLDIQAGSYKPYRVSYNAGEKSANGKGRMLEIIESNGRYEKKYMFMQHQQVYFELQSNNAVAITNMPENGNSLAQMYFSQGNWCITANGNITFQVKRGKKTGIVDARGLILHSNDIAYIGNNTYTIHLL